jgi:hypothetical protein
VFVEALDGYGDAALLIEGAEDLTCGPHAYTFAENVSICKRHGCERSSVVVDGSVPSSCRTYGLTGSVVFGKQFDGTRPALDARREGRAVLAGNHEGVAGLEFVGVDMPAARDTMDVVDVVMGAAGLGGGQRFSFSLGQSLFTFHRSLRHSRMRRRVGGVIRGLAKTSKREREACESKMGNRSRS